MKKIVSLMIAALLLFSLSLPAFADTDGAGFDDWIVVCGPAGYSFVDEVYDEETDTTSKVQAKLKPGTKLIVEDYLFDTKEYRLWNQDWTEDSGQSGTVYVKEKDLDKYFTGAKKPVREEMGEKLKKEVKCVVTSDVGIMLRQGPNKNYPAYKTIPHGTKLSYRYVREDEKYTWGYVTYKGQAGWCCIDYTRDVEATTEATTKATTEPTTEEPTETTAKVTTEPSTKAPVTTTTAAPDATTEAPEAPEPSSFFGNTNAVIIICCMGAVILALTAVVFLLIVKRKRNDFENGQ